MAAITGTVIAAAATGYAAKTQSDAAKKAGKTQANAADASIAEQQRQFDRSIELTQPQRIVGNQATNAAGRLLGLAGFNPALTTGQPAAPTTSLVGDTELPIEGRRIVDRGRGNYDVFYGDTQVGTLVKGGKNGRFKGNGATIPQPAPVQLEGAPQAPAAPTADPYGEFLASPDYEFRRDEGNRDIANSYAARGSGRSGNALRALTEFNSNLASGEFNNRFNRLAALAGFGQAANSQAAGNAIATGRGVSSSLQDAGSARASGVIGSADAISGGIAGLAGTIPLFQDALQQRKMNRLGGADVFNRSIATSNAFRG